MRRSRVTSLLLTALLAWSANVSAQWDAASVPLQQQILHVSRERAGTAVAIARIRRETGPIPRGDPFAPFPIRPSRLPSTDFVPNDFGTGVLVRSDEAARPVVLTNYHVVRGGPTSTGDEGTFELVVRLSTRHQMLATILAADPRSDLAVLELSTPRLPRDMPVVTLGEPVDLERGRFVVAFANPYAMGRDGSMSAVFGMVANVGRRPAPAGPPLEEATRREETLHHSGTLLTIDARLDLGASGGPLFDLDGNLAGLTTSLAALEGYEKSAGYAVPMDAVTHRVVADLVRGYEVEYGFLGVEPLDFTQNEMAGLPEGSSQATAAKVGQVFPNSPANRGLTPAGGLYRNDVVLSVRSVKPQRTDPVPVYDKQDLIREVGRLPPEAEVELEVVRAQDPRRVVVRIRLGKWPVENEEEIVAPHTRYPDWRGVRVDYPTGRRRHFGKPYVFHEAVLVTRVDSAARISPQGEQGELRAGAFVSHVNGQPVSTPAEFNRVTRTIEGPAVLRTLGGEQYEILPTENR